MNTTNSTRFAVMSKLMFMCYKWWLPSFIRKADVILTVLCNDQGIWEKLGENCWGKCDASIYFTARSEVTSL